MKCITKVCKYVEKQSGKKKGKLPEFDHSLQHMKSIGGLKVGLEKNHHKQKKVWASRS
jgi:hypothetical protein